MRKIYLARHGQDEDNARAILNGHRDKPLTALGKEQAELFAKNIKELDLKIKKVYSSPLQRAYNTALAATEILGLDNPEKLDLLIERDFGTMTGKLISEALAINQNDLIHTDGVIYLVEGEGMETFPKLINRAKKLFSWLEENDNHENILLVCHGDIGKMIYCAFYNLDWKSVLSEFHFGNTEIILLENGLAPEKRIIYNTKQENI